MFILIVSIFVKSSFPQRKIDLQIELQATAVSATLDREIPICSVYIPPSFSLNAQHLENILQQLPFPYIILGDFNGRWVHLWNHCFDHPRRYLRGWSKQWFQRWTHRKFHYKEWHMYYTYQSPSTKSFTSINLSFCHPSLSSITVSWL